MAAENELVINFRAQDAASDKIKALELNVKGLKTQLQDLTSTAYGETKAPVFDEIKANIAAYEEEIKALKEEIYTLKLQAQEYKATQAAAEEATAGEIQAEEELQRSLLKTSQIIAAQRGLDVRASERGVGKEVNSAQILAAQRNIERYKEEVEKAQLAQEKLLYGGKDVSSAQIIRAQRGLETKTVEPVVGKEFNIAALLRAQRITEKIKENIEKTEFSGDFVSQTNIMSMRRRVSEDVVPSLKNLPQDKINEYVVRRNELAVSMAKKAKLQSEIEKSLENSDRYVKSMTTTKIIERNTDINQPAFTREQQIEMGYMRKREPQYQQSFTDKLLGRRGKLIPDEDTNVNTSGIRNASGEIVKLGQSSKGTTKEIGHLVSSLNELSRGQKGQLFSTIGAAIRDAGFGATTLATSVVGLSAVMAGISVGQEVENLGNWARSVQAGSTATGMSIENFSRFGNAMVQLGAKEKDAEEPLKAFAKAINEAMAEPSSKAAHALEGLGLDFDTLKQSGGDTAQLFIKLAENMQTFNRTGASGDALTARLMEVFKGHLEAILPLLDSGRDKIQQMFNVSDETGNTASKEMIETLKDLDEKVVALSNDMQGKLKQAFITWAPEISTAIDFLDKMGKAVAYLAEKIHELPDMTPKFDNVNDVIGTGWYDLSMVPARAIFGQGLGRERLPEDQRLNTVTAQIQGQSKAEPLSFDVPKVTVPDIEPIKTSYDDSRPKVDVAQFGGEESGYDKVQDQVRKAKLAAAENFQKVGAQGAGSNLGFDSSTALNIAETTAAVNTLKAALSDLKNPLDTADQKKVQRELETQQLQLVQEQVSVQRQASHQSYEDFAAGEREKVASARNGITEINKIYTEWYNEAGTIFKQPQSVLMKIKTEWVDADARDLLQQIAQHKEEQTFKIRVEEEEVKIRDLVDKSGGKKSENTTDIINQNRQGITDTTEELYQETAAYGALITDANQSQKTQTDAQNALRQEILSSMSAVDQYASAMQAAAQKAADAWNKPFVDLFNKLGNQFDSFGSSLFDALVAPKEEIRKIGLTSIKVNMQGSELREAAAKLFEGMGQDLVKSAMDGLSKLAARNLAPMILGKADGGNFTGGMGDLLGKGVGKLFGGADKATAVSGQAGATASLEAFSQALIKATSLLTQHGASTTADNAALNSGIGPKAADAAASHGAATAKVGDAAASLKSAGSKTIDGAVTDKHTASVIGNSIATDAGTTAKVLNTTAENEDTLALIFHKAISFLTFGIFEQGGIVPSAAGGMVVGGGSGGVPSILHPYEMVLPRNLSEGVQNMINNGYANNNNNNSRSNMIQNVNNSRLNYTPNITVNQQGKDNMGGLTEMLMEHGDSMLGEVNNLFNRGWR